MARRPRGLPRVPLDHPPVALRRDLFKSMGRAARARPVGVRRRAIRLRIRPAVASACLPASRSPVVAHRRDVIDQHPPLLLQGKGCQLRCETPSASRGSQNIHRPRDSPGLPVPHKARTRRAGRYAVRQLRRRPVRRQGWRRPWIRQRRPRRHDDARKGQGAAPPGTRLIFDTCMHTRPALAIAIPAIGFTSVPSTI